MLLVCCLEFCIYLLELGIWNLVPGFNVTLKPHYNLFKITHLARNRTQLAL